MCGCLGVYVIFREVAVTVTAEAGIVAMRGQTAVHGLVVVEAVPQVRGLFGVLIHNVTHG